MYYNIYIVNSIGKDITLPIYATLLLFIHPAVSSSVENRYRFAVICILQCIQLNSVKLHTI